MDDAEGLDDREGLVVGPAGGSREGNNKGLKDVDGLDDTEGSVESDDETEGIEDLVGKPSCCSLTSILPSLPFGARRAFSQRGASHLTWCTTCI